MAELSNVQARIGQQDRPVYRRDGVLPRQMGPGDSPQRRDQIDMGAGRRGDSGAAAVMQLVRQINGAVDDVVQYRQQKYIYDEQQNAFKAVGDEARGIVDEDLRKESLAYKAAYSLSRIETKMAEAKLRMLKSTQDLIDGYEGADLEELMGMIDQNMAAELQSILMDPETGEVYDLGTAQAYAVAGNRVGTLTEETRTDARNLARNKVAENGRSMELNRGLAEVRANGTIDIPKMWANLETYGLSDKAKEETLLNLIEIVDREDPGKAAAMASQLMGLPNEARAVRQPGQTTTKSERLAPTGRLPVSGPITSRIGDGRGHNGVDIDGKIGDPVVAPAGGKVLDVGYNERSGKFVIIDHGNGVTSSYSHLDSYTVGKGDIVRPGQRFAAVGNSGRTRSSSGGDGSHLHWVVKVKNKMVDPLSFKFGDYEVQNTVVAVPAAPNSAAPQGPTLVVPAGFRFSSEGLARLATLREQSTERNRIKVERAEQETFERNGEALHQDIVKGNWPSDDRLRAMAESGQISWDMALNFKTMREQKERADRVEADRIEDRAERQANESSDRWAAETAMSWRLGEGPKTNAEYQKWLRTNSSRLGTGSNWIQNEAMLRGAWQGFNNMTTNDPTYRMYDGMLRDRAGGRGQGPAGGAFGGGKNRDVELRARARYQYLVVKENKDPETAFNMTAKEFGLNGTTPSMLSVDPELQELARRRQAAGIN